MKNHGFLNFNEGSGVSLKKPDSWTHRVCRECGENRPRSKYNGSRFTCIRCEDKIRNSERTKQRRELAEFRQADADDTLARLLEAKGLTLEELE